MTRWGSEFEDAECAVASLFLASAGGAWTQGLFEKPHGPRRRASLAGLAGIRKVRRRRLSIMGRIF